MVIRTTQGSSTIVQDWAATFRYSDGMRIATPVAVVLAALTALAGCTDTADVFPMNAAAQRLGPVKATFIRTGTGRGPVTITMADGEVLTGEYRVAFDSSVGMAFAGPRSSSAIVINDGPMQFVATGPRTQMLCRGTSAPTGHGNGQCQTFDGAVWAISW
jgi:hypothetical protein